MQVADFADFAWCNKFIDTFPIQFQHQFASFLPFCKQFEDEI